MLPQPPDDLHLQFKTTVERVADVLERAIAPLTTARYYVFLNVPASSSGSNAPAKPRTIPAFVSPDDAVTFAQRNGASPKIRVRGITSINLLRYMLATPTIGTVLFLQALPGEPVTQRFPPGIAVTRECLVQQLTEEQYGSPTG
ncbi:MAG: hypothetical protein H0X37_26500 [Herpetosiphonaceae bacterium]|nr:hypothetical protein [Herpetosiphonaceae bacterium]